MPIDAATALSAHPSVSSIEWKSSDVILYHLGLGAGTAPTDARGLRYATEDDLIVLPTFALVAPVLRETAPPRIEFPGICIGLSRILHAGQEVEIHGPLPVARRARASQRVVDLQDKGSAAVIVVQTVVSDADGELLWTDTSSIFARPEGGFGGPRGRSDAASPPSRAPDAVLHTSTMAQQALLYRLLGDRNPLHSNPDFARAAGISRPILHGLCTYGMVCKAVVDELLDGDIAAVKSYAVRFAGVVYPGETLSTAVWQDGSVIRLETTVTSRWDAKVLTAATLTVR